MAIIRDDLVDFTSADFDVCICACHHTFGGVKTQHITPCCRYCENCGKNIILSAYNMHREKCLGKEAV